MYGMQMGERERGGEGTDFLHVPAAFFPFFSFFIYMCVFYKVACKRKTDGERERETKLDN